MESRGLRQEAALAAVVMVGSVYGGVATVEAVEVHPVTAVTVLPDAYMPGKFSIDPRLGQVRDIFRFDPAQLNTDNRSQRRTL